MFRVLQLTKNCLLYNLYLIFICWFLYNWNCLKLIVFCRRQPWRQVAGRSPWPERSGINDTTNEATIPAFELHHSRVQPWPGLLPESSGARDQWSAPYEGRLLFLGINIFCSRVQNLFSKWLHANFSQILIKKSYTAKIYNISTFS